MSGNAPESHEKIDRRVRRTRDALGDALIGLLQEKPFDSITVQEVLDRAGVSRSTFYAHYRDKDDLFLSDAEEFLEAMATMLDRTREASDRVFPVRELFAHVAEMRKLHAALAASGRMGVFLELAQGHFARGIERRLATSSRSRGIPAEQRTALAPMLAGALLSLMTWWLDRGAVETAQEMDRLFHRTVWSGASAERPDASR